MLSGHTNTASINSARLLIEQIHGNQSGLGILNIDGTVFPTVFFIGYEQEREAFRDPHCGWTEFGLLRFLDINSSV